MPRASRPRKPRVELTSDAYEKRFVNRDDKLSIRYRAGSLPNISREWDIWTEFCSKTGVADPDQRAERLSDLSIGQLEYYMHWRINNSEILTFSAAVSVFKAFRCAVRVVTQKAVDHKVVSSMTAYLKSLQVEFGLDMVKKKKDTASVDDLLILLRLLWDQRELTFANYRQSMNLCLFLLISAYTGQRPGSLAEVKRLPTLEQDSKVDPRFRLSEKEIDAEPDYLRYRDIELRKIRALDGSNVFIAIVQIRLQKNNRNQGEFPRFILHERDDNLALCPLLLFFAFAFADNAFESKYLREPADLYRFEVPDHLQSVPLEFKDEWLDKPILRRAEGHITSATAATRYHDVQGKLHKLGDLAGYPRNVTFYAFRRGAGESIDAITTDAVRNRAMGHTRSEIFTKYYTNSTVSADTQSCFLETPSRDWCVKTASHMSLDRDPNFKTHVRGPTQEEVDANEEVFSLSVETKKMKAEIEKEYGSVRKSPKNEMRKEYESCRTRLNRLRNTVAAQIYRERRKWYFANRGTLEICRQRTDTALPDKPTQSVDITSEDNTPPQVPLLFKNLDASSLQTSEAEAQRLAAMELLLALCPKSMPRKPDADERPAQDQSQICDSGADDGKTMFANNQCPFCLKTYRQRKDLLSHVDKDIKSLAGCGGTRVKCPFKACGQELATDLLFRNHMAAVHDFHLSRPQATVCAWSS